MSIFRYKHLISLMLLVFFATLLGVYWYMTPPEAEKEPQTTVVSPPKKIVESSTQVYLAEYYALCKKQGFACRTEILLSGEPREALTNKTQAEIEERYPAEAGWTVDWTGSRLVLEQVKPGLCPEHQKRWHLGVSPGGDMVAVYLGPAAVGSEGGLVRETHLKLEMLPQDVQQRVRNGTFEFLNWDDVIATLDSLVEYSH